MKKSELVRILMKAGCILVKQGANHELWKNPRTGEHTIVSRTKKEVPTFVAHQIIKQLTRE